MHREEVSSAPLPMEIGDQVTVMDEVEEEKEEKREVKEEEEDRERQSELKRGIETRQTEDEKRYNAKEGDKEQ